MGTAHATRTVLATLPPSVQYFQIGALVSGRGSLQIASATTSDTTTVYWNSAALDVLDTASWIWTSAQPDDSAADAVSPPLKMLAAPTWEALTAQVITLNPAVVSTSGTIWALALAPIWQNATV